MEVEELCLIFEYNDTLISQCQQIQYDSTNKSKAKVFKTEQP